jgi:hypothetical protein
MYCGGGHLGFPIDIKNRNFVEDFPMIISGPFGFNFPSGFPMGKMFQNASSLKPLGQLKPNCPGMIIGRSSTKFLFFDADRKSKMAATAGQSCRSRHFEFHIGTKNLKIVENHPMNIHVQFGFNHICSF